MEDLECNITTLATRVQILSQEKLELQEEVNELRERLVVAEDNCIQLEAEKQETDFLLQLVTSEKEELLSRFSVCEGFIERSAVRVLQLSTNTKFQTLSVRLFVLRSFVTR